MSHPARGVWIEIQFDRPIGERNKSHPARGVWIEICQFFNTMRISDMSHPARGVWIEILTAWL